MATITPNLGLQVPQIGGDAGPAYAQEINASLGILDNVLGGAVPIDVSAGGAFVLTPTQLDAILIEAIGTPASPATLLLPSTAGRLIMFQNSVANSVPVGVSCVGGSVGLNIPNGTAMLVYSDGVTPRFSNPYGYTEIGTGVFNGASALTVPLPASFQRYRVSVTGVVTTVNNNAIGIQFSTDGGVTVQSANYNAVIYGGDNNASGFVQGQQPASADVIFGSAAISNAVPGVGCDATWEISPGVANAGVASLRGSACHLWPSPGGTNTLGLFQVAGIGVTQAARVNALRLLPTSPTGVLTGTFFGGTYIVEGLP